MPKSVFKRFWPDTASAKSLMTRQSLKTEDGEVDPKEVNDLNFQIQRDTEEQRKLVDSAGSLV